MEIVIRFIAGAIAFAIGIFIAELLLHIIRQHRQKKPCKYCDGSLTAITTFRSSVKAADVYISKNSLVAFADMYSNSLRCSQKINYCPMCGRKLK